MNERIKELAKEAGLWRQHYDIGEESPERLEKFAELIVNECYNRAERQYHHSGDEWDKGVMAVMDSIEELFRS